VTTIAGSFSESGNVDGPGSKARFSNASDVCISNGAIFVADTANHLIRRITFKPSASAGADATLRLNLFPGLEITGTPGRAYRIDSSTDAMTWGEEARLFLLATPQLWIDPKPVRQKKFYRAVALP